MSIRMRSLTTAASTILTAAGGSTFKRGDDRYIHGKEVGFAEDVEEGERMAGSPEQQPNIGADTCECDQRQSKPLSDGDASTGTSSSPSDGVDATVCPSCNRPSHQRSDQSTITSSTSQRGGEERPDASTTETKSHENTVIEVEVPSVPRADGTSMTFNLDASTEQNYEILSYNYTPCSGKYASIRSTLDYAYHSHYQPARQRLQDDIVSHLLNRTTIQCSVQSGRTCPKPQDGKNWIVFTAGAFGAGKTHTIRLLSQRGRFPLQGFVSVDPDEIRRHLPEFKRYVANDAIQAGERTRKEAGYLSEILAEAALREGRNVLVDGSLRDAAWYEQHFADLRRTHTGLSIAILHVTAPRSAIFSNVMARSKVTGRVVPREKIEMALQAVPKSVNKLKPRVDYFCEIHNSPEKDDVMIVTEGIGWEDFAEVWKQQCPPAMVETLQQSPLDLSIRSKL